MGLIDFIKGLFKEKTIHCPNCKNVIKEDSEYCEHCGIPILSFLRKRCHKCKELNQLTAKKCFQCGEGLGSDISFVCITCGYQDDSFFVVCPVCGVRIL